MSEHRIEHLGELGDGVAPGPIFAPLCLPGEAVSGTIEGDHLVDIRILEPSGDRVQPPCRHFKACGGCRLQHASDEFVANWKQSLVISALERRGIEASFRPIVTSPPKSRRRATFSARRTKKGALVGFHGRASNVISEIPDCQLVVPELVRGIPMMEELAVAGASRKEPLAVTVTHCEVGLDVSVEHGKPLDRSLRAELARISGDHRLSRLVWSGEQIIQSEPPQQSFDGISVTPPSGAFMQATKHGEEALIHSVCEAVGDAKVVADLFAGCGTFSLPLAKHASVHAVESVKSMVDALDLGWRRAKGLRSVSSEARDLFARPLDPEELNRFDALVIDPPRAGAVAQIREIAQSQLKRVAMVSCNPATFARDVEILVAAGFTVDWVQVVDQFRWSAHIEVVAQLSRDKTALPAKKAPLRKRL